MLCFRRFHEVFQIGLDNGYFRTIDNLYTVALVNNTGSTTGFQHGIVYQFCILYCHPQACCTAVQIGQVCLSAQTFQHHCTDHVYSRTAACFFLCLCRINIASAIEFRLYIVRFSARCFQVQIGDHKVEYEVVNNCIDQTDNHDPDPVGFRIAL